MGMMPGYLPYLHPPLINLPRHRRTTTTTRRVASLVPRVVKAMLMAITTTMMMMTTVLGTLLITHHGLDPTDHIVLPVTMMTGATQVAQAENVKASTITTMDIGSIFRDLSRHLHRPKEERPRVASLALKVASPAPKAERAMPTGTTMMTMMMTILMVMVAATDIPQTMVPDMDQATTLDMVMMIGATPVGILTQLGRVDQDTGLLGGHSQPMCRVLLHQASQARPRVARQRKVNRPHQAMAYAYSTAI